MSRPVPVVLWLAVCLVGVSARVLAQGPTPARLSGHVAGPGGVAIPGATVTATEQQSGARRRTWTDAAGNYVLQPIPPGVYRVEIALTGFRAAVRDSVTVGEGQPIEVDATLAIDTPAADPAAAASATGAPAPAAAPAAGRAPVTRPPAPGGATRSAGSRTAQPGGPERAPLRFSVAEAGGVGEQDEQAGSEMSSRSEEGTPTAPEAAGPGSDVGGMDAEGAANSFLLAGSVGRAPTPMGAPGDRPGRGGRFGPDGGQRGGAGAPGFGGGGPGGMGPGMAMGMGPGMGMMFGGPQGGRGTRVNRLRGSFQEEYSNSAFDARPFALNGVDSPQIASYHEQAGFTLGGPLSLPGLFPKDKTMLFGHYNVQRSRTPVNSFATVPTSAERAGDFSGAATLFDPQSGAPGLRTPFPGNQIPSDRLDPAAVKLLQFIPLPNLPGTVNNFRLSEAVPSASDRIMGRVNRQLSTHDALNVAYAFNSTRSTGASSFPALSQDTSSRGQNLTVGETHTFASRRLVQSFSFTYSRQRSSTLNPFAYQNDIASALGIQGVSDDPRNWGLPLISFTNFTALNDAIPSLAENQTFRFVDSIVWSRGKHTWRLGGEVRRVELDTLTDPNARGTFTFTGAETSALGAQGLPVAGTGLDFADFLLGLPQITTVRFGAGANALRSWVSAFSVQDDWRPTSRLTFNLGLRYEYFQPFIEQNGQLSNLAIAPDGSSVTVVTGQAPGDLPPSLVQGDHNNLAPRVGVAFRPSSKRSLVLRAGYGRFYDGSIYSRLVTKLVNQPPFAEASTLVSDPRQVLTLENGFPVIAPTIARNTFAVDPNFRTPYAQTWTAGAEGQLQGRVTWSASYVETRGSELDLLLGPNRAATGTTLVIGNAQQFTYETSGAHSIYRALQVQVRRQFHDGLAMSAAYTYSRSMDDASSIGGAGNTVVQNPNDLAAEWGPSVFDMRHRLVTTYIYELPFGSGKRFLDGDGLLPHLFGHWQVSSVMTFQSGTPFTARVLGNQGAGAGMGAYLSGRADATGLPVALPSSEQTPQEYFNILAFTLPPPGRFGDAGRNTIPGPGLATVNMSLDRFFTLSVERGRRLDFRINATNLLNRANFTGLDTVVNSLGFGSVTGVRPMRAIDVSFRLMF